MGDVLVGTRLSDTGDAEDDLWLPYEHRTLGTAIIGKTGTGKSSVLEPMILEDLESGTAGLLIDPHGSLAQRVIELASPQARERVVLVESSVTEPFGLNLLACRPAVDGDDDEPDIWAADTVVQTIKKLHGEHDLFQPRAERLLWLVARTLIHADRTLVHALRLLNDTGFRANCLKSITDRTVRRQLADGWRSYEQLRPHEQVNYAESLVNRLEVLLAPRAMQYMLGSRRTTLPIDGILRGECFLIASLPAEEGKLGDTWCNFIGSLILCALVDRIFARGTSSTNPRLHIYLDEYQRFETDTMKRLFAEGRKFNVGLTVAHQARGQIKDVSASDAELQCGNLVVLGVTREDADVLAGEFPVEQREEWIEEIEIEDRDEPILVPTRSPVDHIIHGPGHSNPKLNAAARRLFIKETNTSDYTPLQKKYPLAVSVKNPHIDRVLVLGMDGVSGHEDEFHRMLFHAIFAYDSGGAEIRRKRSLDNFSDEYAHVFAPHYERTVGNSATDTHMFTTWPGEEPKLVEAVIYFVRHWIGQYRTKPGFYNEPHIGPESGTYSDQDTGLVEYLIGVQQRKVYATDYRFVPTWGKEYEQQRMLHLTYLYRERLRCILALFVGLANDPIWVASGQSRSRNRVQLVNHPRQTEQDARNELAGRLVNPQQRYVAHLKTPDGYCQAKLDRLRTADRYSLAVEDVRVRSRALYAIEEYDFDEDNNDEPVSTIGRRT